MVRQRLVEQAGEVGVPLRVHAPRLGAGPHLLLAVGSHDVVVSPRAEGVVGAAVSQTLIHMMQHVITEVPFYRDRTLVPGYDVGGKTGTAQIWDPKANHGKGAWKVNLFNYSFVGFIRQTPPATCASVRP